MGEQQIFNLLIEFFEEDEWDFQWVSGMSILSMGFSGQNGNWMCYAQAREAQQQLAFYSVLPINVPPNKRRHVAEFITRVNYGMVIGNFEMDYDDGEVRYKTSADVEGFDLPMPMIRHLVYANLLITDRYLPGLMRVMYGDIAPIDAIDEIELQDEYEDLSELDIDDIELAFDEEYDDTFGYLDDEYDDDDDLDALNDDDDDTLDDSDDRLSNNGKHP